MRLRTPRIVLASPRSSVMRCSVLGARVVLVHGCCYCCSCSTLRVPFSPCSMAQERAGVRNTVPSNQQHTQREEEPPPPTPAPQDPPQIQGQQPEQHSSSHAPVHATNENHDSNGEANNSGSGAAAAAMVTPDEVLTLGVLTLAGLWPGCWNGIAAIIVHKVERLKTSGAADASFQRCARSLVDLLLRNPGEASLAAETWQHLADAQARLPKELRQVLSLACSLLQRRSLEASDARAKRKRRRAFSSDAVAARAGTIPHLPIPCTPAMLTMASDVVREQEEQEEQERKQRQREFEGSAVVPRLLPPSEVLPLLLQQPQPPPPPPPPPALVAAEAAQQQPQPPAPASASPGAAPVPPDQLIPAQPQLSGEVAAETGAHPVYSMAAGVGGTEAEFPVLLPHAASSAPVSPRPAANWETNGGHQGPQGSDLSSPPHPPQEADFPSQLAAAASGPVVAPPASEATRDPTSSIP